MRNSLVTERDCCEYNCIWHASSLLSLFLTIKYLRQHFCFRTSFSRVDYFRNSKLYVRSSRRALWGSHSFSNRDQKRLARGKTVPLASTFLSRKIWFLQLVIALFGNFHRNISNRANLSPSRSVDYVIGAAALGNEGFLNDLNVTILWLICTILILTIYYFNMIKNYGRNMYK